MRLMDILTEERLSQEIANDSMDWLAAYQLKGHDRAPMSGPNGLVSYLNGQGYHSVTVDLVMDLLSGDRFSGIVKRSTPKEIYLNSVQSSSEVPKNEMERSEEKVMRGAAKGAKKIVKGMTQAGV